MKAKQAIYLLVLIILIGSFLRFYNLDGESFWLDEGTTSLTVIKYSALGILDNVKAKGQVLPDYYSKGKHAYDEDLPAYYMILRWWTDVVGYSEFAFRSFSAIFGILSLIAIFYLTRYLFNDKIALTATFLSSINLTLIWYSQEARQYIYLLFLSILSLIFLLKSLREKKTGYIVGFFIVSVLIMYSHFPWLIFITFEGLYALYVMYTDFKKNKTFHVKLLASFIITGILYLFIIGRALHSKSAYIALFGRPGIIQVVKFAISLSTWLYPSIEMRDKVYASSFNFSFFEWSLIFSVFAIALLLSVLFLYGVIKSLKGGNSDLFMLMFFFFPFLFAFGLSLIHPTITVFMIRQLIYLIPAFLILAAVGISKTKYFNLILVTIIALSVLPVYSYYANIDKPQFREAVAYLPKDEPVFLNIETAQAVFKYYSGEKENVVGVADLDELRSHLSGMKSFWMLLTFTKYSDPNNTIKEFLDKNYNLIESKKFFDIELLHYERADGSAVQVSTPKKKII